MSAQQNGRKNRLLAAAVTFLCFLLFGGICFAAGSLIWRQGQEVEVSVETSGEGFTEQVTFTVSNILGMDILIDEREDSCAVLQYRGEDGWEDVCKIRFTEESGASLSVKYGGMYAHLAPGGQLRCCLEESLLDTLPSGEYRVAIPYISEDAYLDYLQERAEEIDESLANAREQSGAAEQSVQSGETSAETVSDGTDEESIESGEEISGGNAEQSSEGSGEDSDAEPAVMPAVEIFYKEFTFINRADSSAEPSEETSGGLDVSIAVQ